VLNVQSVTTSQSAFLVVYQSVNGEPGSLVGKSGLISPDEGAENLNVTFGSIPGQSYIVMLRDDDGDGMLDESKDNPATDADGKSVTATFSVPGAPSAAADVAPANSAGAMSDSITLGAAADGKVTVASVTLSKPGFVGIYESMGGDPGPMVGKSNLLSAGTAQNVSVSFSGTTGKTYFAMLRADNGDGKLDEMTDNPINDASNNTVMQKFTYPTAK
jgi:hypothetical protein